MQKKPSSLYVRPDRFAYGLIAFVGWIFHTFVFRRKLLRNELRNAKGSFVLLGNHECALDCVNTVGLTRRKMTYVVSFAFFNTLPVRPLLKKIGVIVKQQFKTKMTDLKKMKAVIEHGEGLVLYPAGLMSENGRSTPIPTGSWQLLKWLDADVYAARTYGAYFVMPKWGKGFRPGRTYMDVYRLFTREELKTLSEEEIRRRGEDALLFDAYREQEQYRIPYKKGDCVEGLETVLYRCPSCGAKYTIKIRDGHTLTCTSCGFSRTADKTGLFSDAAEDDYRYASDWSVKITEMLSREIDENYRLSLPCRIEVIDFENKCFRPAGEGVLTLNTQGLTLSGTVDGKALALEESVKNLPYLPFSPGRRLEVQTSSQSYRCYPEEGNRVMEFIQALSIINRRSHLPSDSKKTE